MMDWLECKNRRMAREASPDEGMIRSLIKSSNNKLESGRRLVMSDVTASSKLSLAYDSLRELLEALALSKGFKIYNHECYSAFLKDVMGSSDKADDFDVIRRVRNSVNYYGKELGKEEASDIIGRATGLRSFVSSELKH